MQRGPEQGISREVGGGGVSVSNTTVSQGRPSPLVEAAIRPDGGQMRPVTSAALAVTHFYFGGGMVVVVVGGLFLRWRLGEWSMSQRCSCELMI